MFNKKLYLKNYQRNWVRNRRLQYFKDKVCVKCGSVENLELDHIDPSKKISHRIWSWSSKRILEETSKCQILCIICHKIKTKEERYRPITHGVSGYKRFCRCQICKLAQSNRLKDYKVRKIAGLI